jgi:beta-xylosidase
VHQLFLNKEGWLMAAPYQTTDEKLDPSICTVDNVAGKYEVILHELTIDYENLEAKTPEVIFLNADGTVTGYYEGTWKLEEGTSYIYITLNGVTYSGVALEMNVENLKRTTVVFTALGQENQLTLWGSKMTE